MIYVVGALVLLAVVAVVSVALLVRRGPDVVSEVDRFTRAREMTTGWSRGGWTGPPRSPHEARDAGGGSSERPEPESGEHG